MTQIQPDFSAIGSFSPENHSKSFVTNDFQPSHSHLIAEAPESCSKGTALQRQGFEGHPSL